MNHVGFILDLGRCVGCGACVLACRLENQLPENVTWRRVLPFNLERYPGGPAYHFSLACNHCDHPACQLACPAGAYQKRANGIVLIDQNKCIGCRYCEMACPFGAPSYDADEGVMTKCHLCVDRINIELSPACMDACPTEALSLLQHSGMPERSEAAWLESLNQNMPGFVDPALCAPNIRFIPPRGQLRTKRLRRLQEVLSK
jgi:DMSO reductase iron-sulfur subunit